MPQNRYGLNKTIAQFLEASRIYFGLPVRRRSTRMSHRPFSHSRKLLRSLLLATSIGAAFGSPAFADTDSEVPPSVGSRSDQPQSDNTLSERDASNDEQTGNSKQMPNISSAKPSRAFD